MAVDRDKFSNHPDCPERPCRPRSSRPTPLPKLRAAISPDAPRGCGSLGAPKSLHRPAPAPPPRPPPTTLRLQGSVSLSLPRPHLFSGLERGARSVGVGIGGGVAVRPTVRPALALDFRFLGFCDRFVQIRELSPLAAAAASTWSAQAPDLGRRQRSELGRTGLEKRLRRAKSTDGVAQHSRD